MWPSQIAKFSRFEELIKKSYFKPSANVNVIVKVQQANNEEFPVPSCSVCASKFDAAKLRDAVNDVHWEMLSASTYNLEGKVSESLIKRTNTLMSMHNNGFDLPPYRTIVSIS